MNSDVTNRNALLLKKNKQKKHNNITSYKTLSFLFFSFIFEQTSREVGLAGRVVSIISIFIIPAQQVVDSKVDIQVGPLEFPNDHTPGLPLKDYLGLGKGTSRKQILLILTRDCILQDK